MKIKNSLFGIELDLSREGVEALRKNVQKNMEPVLNIAKEAYSNPDQFKTNAKEGLKKALDSAKNSRAVNDYILPAIESEQADKAMKALSQKAGHLPFVVTLEKLRNDLLAKRTSSSEPVVSTSEEVAVEAVSEETVDVVAPTKTKKKAAEVKTHV